MRATMKTTTGKQSFNIPNDEQGREFIKLAKKYLNRCHFSAKSRGRGSRKNGLGTQLDVSLENAEWLALYLNDKTMTKEFNDQWKARYELEGTIRKLKTELRSRDNKINDLKFANDAMEMAYNTDRNKALKRMIDHEELEDVSFLLTQYV